MKIEQPVATDPVAEVPRVPPGRVRSSGEEPARGRWFATLLARTNLVLGVAALGIVFTAIVALYLFVIAPITERAADDQAGLIVLSAQTWVELPPETRPDFELEAAESHDLIISAEARALPAAREDIAYLEILGRKLSERLGGAVPLLEGDDLVWANIETGGYTMQIGFSPRRRNVQPMYGASVIIFIGAAIVFLSSLFIVRRIVRPLTRASRAAERFRGGDGYKPLPEHGPRELVTLARSFNDMAHAISTLMSNRTTLLAGISHDLRTPLARMRIALELLPDGVDPSLARRFERNLEEMEALIVDAMRFARGTEENATQVVLKPLVEAALASTDEDVPLYWNGAEDAVVTIAPGAFQRVLANLVNNAIRHAQNARVAVKLTPHIELRVIDDGPGIPADAREKVFQPFFRLDRSRSSSTGGSGLGLAIVQQLCETHGWSVSLEQSSSGGTDAVVRIDGDALVV